jgi:hypothetical protein
MWIGRAIKKSPFIVMINGDFKLNVADFHPPRFFIHCAIALRQNTDNSGE